MTSASSTVFLHIGAMKTGTTYLQHVLIQNKENLADQGYLFPGNTWGDQVRAAHDVVGHHRESGVRARASGSWRAVVDEMLSFPGRGSVFSVEFLGFAGPDAARRITEDLAGAELHVVLTVRDTREVLPGLWQTHCANGGTASWPAFARSARIGSGTGPVAPLLGQGARLFRRALDVPRILSVWSSVVPPERLHVVTVPTSGSPRGLLWERFASVLGLDPAVASNPPHRHNPSMGYPSAELMRRLNTELGRLPREEYNPTLKHFLAEQVLTERASTEPRAELDVRSHEFALRWNRRTRSALEASGAHVVGELEDIPVRAPADDLPASIVLPEGREVLDAAGTALEGMERLLRRRNRRLRVLGAEEGLSNTRRREAAPVVRDSWESALDPVKAAVTDLAGVCRLAIAMHQQIRQLQS